MTGQEEHWWNAALLKRLEGQPPITRKFVLALLGCRTELEDRLVHHPEDNEAAICQMELGTACSLFTGAFASRGNPALRGLGDDLVVFLANVRSLAKRRGLTRLERRLLRAQRLLNDRKLRSALEFATNAELR